MCDVKCGMQNKHFTLHQVLPTLIHNKEQPDLVPLFFGGFSIARPSYLSLKILSIGSRPPRSKAESTHRKIKIYLQKGIVSSGRQCLNFDRIRLVTPIFLRPLLFGKMFGKTSVCSLLKVVGLTLFCVMLNSNYIRC